MTKAWFKEEGPDAWGTNDVKVTTIFVAIVYSKSCTSVFHVQDYFPTSAQLLKNNPYSQVAFYKKLKIKVINASLLSSKQPVPTLSISCGRKEGLRAEFERICFTWKIFVSFQTEITYHCHNFCVQLNPTICYSMIAYSTRFNNAVIRLCRWAVVDSETEFGDYHRFMKTGFSKILQITG